MTEKESKMAESPETIRMDFVVFWRGLRNASGGEWKWGDKKAVVEDLDWSKKNVLYRWVKDSSKEIAYIGETERRLKDRVGNYTGKSEKAGLANRKVREEQERLQAKDDCLHLEFTENVPGYDLGSSRERKLAERLLIGYYRPYLQPN